MATVNNNNRFDATIIEVLGVGSTSDTQQYRVMTVKDEWSGVRVALQKWWHDGQDWRAGKGFFLKGRTATELSKIMAQDTIDEYIPLSDTQKYWVQSKDGVVNIIKYWREHRDLEWREGKKVDIPADIAKALSAPLLNGGRSILHIR